MQLRDAYPADTAKGCCFISGRYLLEPGDQIIDLDTDLENMPPWGRLCIHPEAVRQFNVLLGWHIDPDIEDRNKRLQATNDELRHENTVLRDALRDVLGAGHLVGITHSDLPVVEARP